MNNSKTAVVFLINNNLINLKIRNNINEGCYVEEDRLAVNVFPFLQKFIGKWRKYLLWKSPGWLHPAELQVACPPSGQGCCAAAPGCAAIFIDAFLSGGDKEDINFVGGERKN